MDLGDLIYLLVFAFIAILGFFNKSEKEKQAKKKSANQPTISQQMPDVSRRVQDQRKFEEKRIPIPVAEPVVKKREFTPSSSTIKSSIEGQSSIRGTLFQEDSFFKDSETNMTKKEIHPLISELTESTTAHQELRKAVLYSEIMNRKF